jgi:hypothetical protein
MHSRYFVISAYDVEFFPCLHEGRHGWLQLYPHCARFFAPPGLPLMTFGVKE